MTGKSVSRPSTTSKSLRRAMQRQLKTVRPPILFNWLTPTAVSYKTLTPRFLQKRNRALKFSWRSPNWEPYSILTCRSWSKPWLRISVLRPLLWGIREKVFLTYLRKWLSLSLVATPITSCCRLWVNSIRLQIIGPSPLWSSVFATSLTVSTK